ncbi:hypothetical protein [Pseudaquabacterium rugosum]|uniref:Agglutinin biogenesis protein MshI n=1 Tax=Pseudaquabacterium rugosum TaxID=2984194 RepID=A0ABU9BCX5_9BURK
MLPGWVACVPQGRQAQFACVQSRDEDRPLVQWVASEDWTWPTRTLRQVGHRHALARHRRVLMLSPTQYRLATLDVPNDLPRPDWPQAMRWQMKDLVDFPVDDAAIDVLAVPDGASYRARSQLIAVAAGAQMLRPQVEAAHQVKLQWTAIDIEETALRNLCALAAPPERSQALLHVQATHATLVVTFRGELLWSRQIDLTLGHLGQSDDAPRQQALDQAGLELQRSLDGIERSFGQVALAGLLITPMPEQQLLCEHLRPLLYVPVTPYEPTRHLDLTGLPGLARDPLMLNRMLCAIGAALRSD